MIRRVVGSTRWLLAPFVIGVPIATFVGGDWRGALIAYLLIGILLKSPLILCSAAGIVAATADPISTPLDPVFWHANIASVWIAIGLLLDCAFHGRRENERAQTKSAVGVLLILPLGVLSAELVLGLTPLSDLLMLVCVQMPIPMLGFAIVHLLTGALFHSRPEWENAGNSVR